MKHYNKRTDAAMMPSTFRYDARAATDERDKEIMKYAPLVMKVVNKFNREDNRVGVFDKHDLIQSGFVGLVEGYDRIIKSDGIPNVNYLEINIKGTIDRHLNYQATGVAIPEYHLQKLKAEIVADRIFGAWMYSFRLDDIDKKAYNSYKNHMSTYDPMMLDSYDNEELSQELSDIMWQLTSREREVVSRSFGVNYPKTSENDLSLILNRDVRTIRRIKRKALMKLNTLRNRMMFEKYL